MFPDYLILFLGLKSAYGMNKAEIKCKPQSGGRVTSKVASVIISKTCRCELSGYFTKNIISPNNQTRKSVASGMQYHCLHQTIIT
ncbi:MAG: hypothetical protein CM15mP62_20220 [Rhodospirillaceae bacterium]|nr:MAG: hypothetical protein CM15mP62_20220 [Rhodospirillaceae bacterium]